MDFRKYQQAELPDDCPPVVIIGAGAIVQNAHLPAYASAGIEVVAVTDSNVDQAHQLGAELPTAQVVSTVAELGARYGTSVVYDVAVPPSAMPTVLRALPTGATALLQKPMGESLAQATEIVAICAERELRASVNFQLRYAPAVRVAKAMIEGGMIGEVVDVDFRVNVHTPWGNWRFLEDAPRMELIYHSIHYLDLIRDLLGEPLFVQARSQKDRFSPRVESAKSSVTLDFGEDVRATINSLHSHRWGPLHQESTLKIEGTSGCILYKMGLNLNYPAGVPDTLEFVQLGGEWEAVPLTGSWMPDAFVGTMAQAMRSHRGPPAPTHVSDALKTMRLVEACYDASDRRGIPFEPSPNG